MDDPIKENCGKCGAYIDSNRWVDFTLKDGTRVCEYCFANETSPQVKRTVIRASTTDTLRADPSLLINGQTNECSLEEWRGDAVFPAAF